MRPPLKRGTWTPQEDRLLTAYINRYGIWNWPEMAKATGLNRSGKSCRLRWLNYLRPDIKHGDFTKEEDETIIQLQRMLGNRWSVIASKLSGRTDNEIKNYWHSYLKKRLNVAGVEIETTQQQQMNSLQNEATSLTTTTANESNADPQLLISYESFDEGVVNQEQTTQDNVGYDLSELSYFEETENLWEEVPYFSVYEESYYMNLEDYWEMHCTDVVGSDFWGDLFMN